MNSSIENIYSIATIYKESFCDKRIEYIYRDKNNKRRKLLIQCKEKNLMHLLGISKYKVPNGTNTSKYKGAQEFFNDCQERKLDTSLCEYEDYIFHQKKDGMRSLDLLLSDKVSICGRGVFEKLNFDYIVRTNRNILALTFIQSEDAKSYLPNSCINLRHGKKNQVKSFKETMKVTEIRVFNLSNELITSIKTKQATPKKYKKKKKKK